MRLERDGKTVVANRLTNQGAEQRGVFRTEYKGGDPARPPRPIAPENSSLLSLLEFCDHPDRPEPFASARRPAAERNTVETVQWQTKVVQRGRREIDDTARCRDDAAS